MDINRVFVQFLNDQMLRNYGRSAMQLSPHIVRSLDKALRAAILVAENSPLIPTIDWVESAPLLACLPSFRSLIEFGALKFCGSEAEPTRFIRHKQEHFKEVNIYPTYFLRETLSVLEKSVDHWLRRNVSTTGDLAYRWRHRIEGDAWRSDPFFRFVVHESQRLAPHADPLEILYRLPERLEGRAFLWDIVRSTKIIRELPSTVDIDSAAKMALGRLWLQSHLDEFDATLFVDFPGLGSLDCGFCQQSVQSRCMNFQRVDNIFRFYGLESLLGSSYPVASLWALSQTEAWRVVRNESIARKLLSSQHYSIPALRTDQIWLRILDSGSLGRVLSDDHGPSGHQIQRRVDMLANLLLKEDVVSPAGATIEQKFYIDSIEIVCNTTHTINAEEMIMSKTEIKLGDGTTIHGDFIIAASIKNSFNRATSASISKELSDLLVKLAKEVGTISVTLPQETAQQAARDLEILTKEATSEVPRKQGWQLSLEGLKQAAKTTGEIGKPILELLAKIVPLLT